MQETQETCIGFLDQEDSLEEEMEAHSSMLPWKIPWTQKPRGLQSMGGRELDKTEYTHTC